MPAVGPRMYTHVPLHWSNTIAGPRVLAGFIDAPDVGLQHSTHRSTTPLIHGSNEIHSRTVFDLTVRGQILTLLRARLTRRLLRPRSRKRFQSAEQRSIWERRWIQVRILCGEVVNCGRSLLCDLWRRRRWQTWGRMRWWTREPETASRSRRGRCRRRARACSRRRGASAWRSRASTPTPEPRRKQAPTRFECVSKIYPFFVHEYL